MLLSMMLMREGVPHRRASVALTSSRGSTRMKGRFASKPAQPYRDAGTDDAGAVAKKGKESRARSLLRSTTQRAIGAVSAALGIEIDEQHITYCQARGCEKTATHICFPCSDLCLCLMCADELMRKVKRSPTSSPDASQMGNSEAAPCIAEPEQASCPVCGQQVLCVIDAQPAGAFTIRSPVDATLRTVAATASSLRRTATTAARNAADVASRHSAFMQPTVMGRSRTDRAEAARRAAASPPNHSTRQGERA